MFDSATLAVFTLASLVLLLTPGPAVLYIVVRSIEEGRRVGFASVMGLSVGSTVHVAAAALGVSTLILTSAAAFIVLKLAGAAYLLYLGWQKFRGPDELDLQAGAGSGGEARAFRQGILVNLLNPKATLFIFAFIPQFVDPGRGSVALQMLGLGMMFTLLGVFSDAVYVMAADRLGIWLKRRPEFRRRQRWLSGGIYVALGLAAAFSGAGRK